MADSCIAVTDYRLWPVGGRLLRQLKRHKQRNCAAKREHWHHLFDPCPALLHLNPPDGHALFDEFMQFLAWRGLPVDWRAHLVLAEWLEHTRLAQRLTPELREALMESALARWASSDTPGSDWLCLGHRDSRQWLLGQRIDGQLADVEYGHAAADTRFCAAYAARSKHGSLFRAIW